jgi:hypothetical protein
VRIADRVLLATEFRDVMPNRTEHWNGLKEQPLPEPIVPWTAGTAKRNFLAKFEELSK